MAENMNNEVVEATEEDGILGFFKAAGEGICNAPVEAKVVAGVGAGLLTVGAFIGGFFVGKKEGAKSPEDLEKETEKKNTKTQATSTTATDAETGEKVEAEVVDEPKQEQKTA